MLRRRRKLASGEPPSPDARPKGKENVNQSSKKIDAFWGGKNGLIWHSTSEKKEGAFERRACHSACLVGTRTSLRRLIPKREEAAEESSQKGKKSTASSSQCKNVTH